MTHRQSCANEHAIQRSFTVGPFASRAASPKGVNCKTGSLPQHYLRPRSIKEAARRVNRRCFTVPPSFIVAPKLDRSSRLVVFTVLLDVKHATVACINLDVAFTVRRLYLDAIDDVAVLFFEFDLRAPDTCHRLKYPSRSTSACFQISLSGMAISEALLSLS